MSTATGPDSASSVEARLLSGLSRAATRLACSGPLQTVLDSVAAEVMAAVAARACTIVLFDARSHAVAKLGTAGHDPDYGKHLREAIHLGAPIAGARAYEERGPVTLRNLGPHLDDPRWKPLAPHIRNGHWTDLIAAPLMDQDRCLGVISVFLDDSGRSNRHVNTFMLTIADHVALAVQNADLIAESRVLAALQERQGLARNLHDSAVQTLFSLSMHARAARLGVERGATVPRTSSEALALVELAGIERLAEEVQREMRALIAQLQPRSDEDLVSRLRRYAADVSRTAAVRVVVVEDDGGTRVDLLAHESEEVFRIVREAVNNSLKHAAPSTVIVTVGHTDHGASLELDVCDDGHGFSGCGRRANADAPHLGLPSMMDRAEALGGRLDVRTSGSGTRVRLVLPATPAARQAVPPR